MTGPIRLHINGQEYGVDAPFHRTLLQVLRDDLGFTGAKPGCTLGTCGCCTPGMILTAKALLDEEPEPTEGQIRQALSGNLCRCTGYQSIIEAVQLASKRLLVNKRPSEEFLYAQKTYAEETIAGNISIPRRFS